MTSYKLNFLLQLVGIFISTLLFFFLSKLFERGMSDYLQPYGGDYFAFVIIGIAIILFYPLTRTRVEEIRNALEARSHTAEAGSM